MQPVSPIVARIHSAALHLFAEQGRPQVNISELAQVAGLSRGSIYNHLPDPEGLFETVAVQLAEEMHARVVASFTPEMDPTQRLANGIRYFIRRAHEEPRWGRFINRFSLTSEALQNMWAGPVTSDVLDGLQKQQYQMRPEQLPSAIAYISGATLSAIFLVLEGHRAWRDAGADTAEFVLRGLGVDCDTAKRYANSALPPLAENTAFSTAQ